MYKIYSKHNLWISASVDYMLCFILIFFMNWSNNTYDK